MAEEGLKVFRTWSSPYALRAVHALKLKGLEFDTVFEDIKNKTPSLLEYNPVYKKVPVLIHNGKPICESLVILEYIDETWKDPFPLLPQNPYDRAVDRFWAKFGDDKLIPSVFRAAITQVGAEQEKAMGEVRENLKLVEEQLKGKKFFGGEKIGYLDIAFGWMANLLSIFGELLGVELVGAETFPELSAWIERFAADPVIGELWPPRDRMVEKFKVMREPYQKKPE